MYLCICELHKNSLSNNLCKVHLHSPKWSKYTNKLFFYCGVTNASSWILIKTIAPQQLKRITVNSDAHSQCPEKLCNVKTVIRHTHIYLLTISHDKGFYGNTYIVSADLSIEVGWRGTKPVLNIMWRLSKINKSMVLLQNALPHHFYTVIESVKQFTTLKKILHIQTFFTHEYWQLISTDMQTYFGSLCPQICQLMLHT